MSTSKAYPGSCHCGFVQYQVRLKFPPVYGSPEESIRLYKCNCTTCHKMGFFHCRPISPQDDFILTSPTSIDELGDYRVFSKRNGWYFCKKCGVRVFGVAGVWEPMHVDVEQWASGKSEGGEKPQLVMRSTPTTRAREVDGKEVTEPYHYLSVNAVTLEPSEEIDLRMWHEKKWVGYMDCREFKGKPNVEKPHEGGMY